MPTITIKQILERDVEYPASTDFLDIESPVPDEVFSEATGPSASAFSDIVYNMTKTLYVTNINSFEFGFVPFNDTLSYDE